MSPFSINVLTLQNVLTSTLKNWSSQRQMHKHTHTHTLSVCVYLNLVVSVYQRSRPHRGRPIPRGHPQQPPVVTATADQDQPAAGLGGARLPRPHGPGCLRPGGLHHRPANPHPHHQDLEPQPQHTDGQSVITCRTASKIHLMFGLNAP